MENNSDSSKREVIVITRLPTEAKLSSTQPMRCDWCGHRYDLPIYEMPDGPIVSVARCPSCGAHSNQMPEEVAS